MLRHHALYDEVMNLRLPKRQLVLASAFLVLFAGLGHAKTKKRAQTSAKHHTVSSSGKSHKRHGARTRKSSWKRHGQQSIAPDRIREIQQALIREKYLNGDPTGKWDTSTQAALVKYQTDNGWQSKVVPDSRALIKLELGPNYSQETLIFEKEKPGSDAVAANASAGNNRPNK